MSRSHRRFFSFLLASFLSISLVAVGCTSNNNNNNNPDGGSPDGTVQQDGKQQGLTIKRKWNFRVVAGVSMGSGMASIIGMRNHEKFDVIGSLGGPMDLSYLLNHFQRSFLGGFCDIKKIEEMAKAGKLDDPASYCAPPKPPPLFEFEHTSHYNDWYYDDAGGNWNRSKLITVIHDLFVAFGNPGYYNPKSPYWPHPDIPADRRSATDRCKNPIVIKGFKHHLYNPEGKYDVITYCDGTRERDGVYRPDRPEDHREPVEVALAVDVNGNGKRDFGEPVISTPNEVYEDVGKDGCPDKREDGKGGCVPEGQSGAGTADPNGDNYDPIDNPNGGEGNLLFDDGEPYKDDGLDGIPGTKDYGEGDGKFTRTPGHENFLAHDPFTLARNLTKEQSQRLNVYIDGGIRDLFNFHVAALRLFGALRSHFPDKRRAQMFNRFITLTPNEKDFDYKKVDWSDKGQHIFIRYGDPNATADQIRAGDGDHVNGGRIIDRVLAFFSFASFHLPNPDLEEITTDYAKGEGRDKTHEYQSKALGRKHIYSVVLPPGFHQYPEKKYPVAYFGHGYGMDGPGMAKLLLLLIPQMANGRLAKMILVTLHGECDKGDPCHKGSFYVNASGLKSKGDGLQMEKAFFEVVQEVENRFKGRIREPAELDYKLPVK